MRHGSPPTWAGAGSELLSCRADAERLWLRIASDLERARPCLPSGSDDVLVKLLVLQRVQGLDDEAASRELADRLSWRRFCGLSLDDEPPSASALRALRCALLAAKQGRQLLTAIEAGAAPGGPVDLSVVVPVYRAEGIVEQLVDRLREELSRLTASFEVVLVEDGSPDGSWSGVRAACQADQRFKAIRLSRNFGQHRAITAGLDRACGRYVVVMDCDLQDDPADIPALHAKAIEGYDVVFAVKQRRRHGWLKNLGGRLFAVLLNGLSAGARADAHIGTFSLLSQRAVEAYRQGRAVHGHYVQVTRWLGFPTASIAVRHRERPSGRSSYSLPRLLRHAVEGLTAHSGRLLYLGLGAGLLFLAVALLGAMTLVVLYFVLGFMAGWTSTIVVILLSTSAVLISVGVIGIYVGSMFEQVKPWPRYLVQETLNLADR